MTTKAKEIERELNKVLCMPKEDVFAYTASSFVTEYLTRLREVIVQFRDDFVLSATNLIGEGELLDDVLLPEGTKFYKQTESLVVFVIEQKPSVRTLFFEESAINYDKDSYRLSLPYIVFIPVFSKLGEDWVVSGVCMGYRNAPLTSMDDVLCHPNLPNIGVGIIDDVRRTNGHVDSWMDMLWCIGFDGDQEFFRPKNKPFNVMAKELIEHFWSSSFNGDLSGYYKDMAGRDERLGSLSSWEILSDKDPAFVLKCEWKEGCRLGALLTSIIRHHDSRVDKITQSATAHVNHVYNETWKLVTGTVEKTKSEVAKTLTKKLEETLHRFSQELSKGLTVINNDTIRRTIQLAVSKAILSAVEGK